MDLGSGRRGVDMGPSAIRIAGIDAALRELGHTVVDEGDVAIKNMEQLKVGDVIEVRDRPASRRIARDNHFEGARVPAYMEPDVTQFKGKIIALPEREDFPKFFQEQQVVEYYAR